MALFERALSRATARPTLTCSFNGMQRSWNGCEFGLQVNIQHGNEIWVVVVVAVVVKVSNDWFDEEGDKLSFELGGDNDDASSIIFKTKSFG